MERFQKIGKIRTKKSSEIEYSKLSLGFEKLDRYAFDPSKTYDLVAETGVKKARIQSGWARTEKEKGQYDFEWLDSIVDNLVDRGIEPWICLCYGNALYTESAKTIYGAVGCPPIFSDEEKMAWERYVKATVNRYKGKVNYYEVWNEPDGRWCWKHGVSGTELGNFTVATAKAVREVYPEAKIIGGVICLNYLGFINEAFKTGMEEYIDYLSFHEYTADERNVAEKAQTLRALSQMYNPDIEIIQGESGTQSRSGGHGALNTGAWTEEIQAKQLARHTFADLFANVHFTSYFSCVDMKEALNGIVGDKSTYLDYGYFGILGACFDDDGNAIGEYYRKPSFYAFQNICSMFSGDVKNCVQPVYISSEYSNRKYDYTPHRFEMTAGSFEKGNAKAYVYWYPSNIMTSSYVSSVNIEFYSDTDDIKLVDIMDGAVYKIPENMLESDGKGVYTIKELPIKDTPLILTFGDFADIDFFEE